MSPTSLKNLKMGAIARNQGKVSFNLTVLPETKKWLKSSGNASERVDLLVSKILKGELIGKTHLDRANAEIAALKVEIAALKSKLK
jgi:hypothetical protein